MIKSIESIGNMRYNENKCFYSFGDETKFRL